MFRRVLIPGGALALLATGTVAYKNELKSFIEPMETTRNFDEPKLGNGISGFEAVRRWDTNWDHRDPQIRLLNPKYDKLSDEDLAKKLEDFTPKANRHIFLIRHGQYHLDSDKKNLTPLGREQAVHLGQRLAKSNLKFDSVVMSTMNRATETALLMMEQMPAIPNTSDSILEEGAPCIPEPKVHHWRPSFKFYEDGARIEAAFRRHIHRASPKQEKDSYELIVCHANVIRYFICRALQLPPEAWLRFSLANTSITWIVITKNGNVSVRSVGDLGHLPPDKVTFT